MAFKSQLGQMRFLEHLFHRRNHRFGRFANVDIQIRTFFLQLGRVPPVTDQHSLPLADQQKTRIPAESGQVSHVCFAGNQHCFGPPAFQQRNQFFSAGSQIIFTHVDPLSMMSVNYVLKTVGGLIFFRS